MKSLKGNIKMSLAMVNATPSTDQTGTSIDLKGYNAIELGTVFGDGAVSYDDTNKIEAYLQESNDGSTWNDVAAEHIQNGLTGTVHTSTYALINGSADENTLYKVDYIGYKRYVRPMLDFIGTHGSGIQVTTIAILNPENILPVV